MVVVVQFTNRFSKGFSLTMLLSYKIEQQLHLFLQRLNLGYHFWISGTFLLLGCINLLNTRKYCDNTCNYCSNTHEYWPNTWKLWSPASAIFASIVTMLVSFEAILMYFKACGRSLLWNWLLKLILIENPFKIASNLQVLSQYLRVLSR